MKKKILFRTSSMEMGEEQRALLNIIEMLDKTRFESFLLLDVSQGELLKNIPKEVKVFYISERREPFSTIKIAKLFQFVTRKITLLAYRYYPELLKSKVNIVPDIEIAMTLSSLRGLINSPFKNSKKINLFKSNVLFLPKRFGNKILSMMERCDVTIFTSDTYRDEFEKHLGEVVYNGVCIPNILNIKRIEEQSLEATDEEDEIIWKTNTFISIGELTHQSGYGLLLRAHVELIKGGVNHQIIIIGDGPTYSNLKKKVKLFEVQNSFFILSNKDNPYSYIARSPYYIQTSRYETFSLFIREAMILNKPVISTNCSEASNIIASNTGLIIGFSKQEIKKAIKTFLFNPILTSDIKANQKKINFERDNQIASQQFIRILELL